MKETYTNAPTAEPKLYSGDAYEYKIIPYSSFAALTAKEGETHALPIGFNTAGIFRLDAASQVTDLGLNGTGFTGFRAVKGLRSKTSEGEHFLPVKRVPAPILREKLLWWNLFKAVPSASSQDWALD